MADNPLVPYIWMDEADRVRIWRFEQLREMGYLRPDAEFLATTDVDIHELHHLIVDQGCPLEVAARILN